MKIADGKAKAGDTVWTILYTTSKGWIHPKLVKVKIESLDKLSSVVTPLSKEDKNFLWQYGKDSVAIYDYALMAFNKINLIQTLENLCKKALNDLAKQMSFFFNEMTKCREILDENA